MADAAANMVQDRTGDDESITLRLAQPELIVESGGPTVDNVAVLTNASQRDESDQYAFEVEDLDPAWYRLEVKSALLLRGDSAQVRIRFTVPRRGVEPGVYMYHVIVRSLSDPAVTTATTGRLRISPPATLQMTLSPESSTGEQAQYAVHLLNSPAGTLVVDLIGQDSSNTLAFTPAPARLRLAPNEEATATLDVAIRSGAVGEARAYPFTLLADLSAGDEGDLPVDCAATFVYVPPVQLEAQLVQEQVRGPVGDYRLVMHNPTSLTLGVEVEALETADLDIYFLGEGSDNLQIRREQTYTMKALVRVSEQAEAGGAQVFPFTVQVRARNMDGPGDLTQVLTTSLDYQALTVVPQATAAPPPVPARTDLLDQLHLELSDQQSGGQYQIELTNTGTESVLVLLEAADEAAALAYILDPPQIYVGAGGQRQALLTVALQPDRPAPLTATEYPFTVTGWLPVVGAGHAITVPGLFTYRPPEAVVFEAELVPVQARGITGQYDVRLINHSSVPLRIVVRGRDLSGLLLFQAATTLPISVPVAGEQTVRLQVRTNALAPAVDEYTYPFEVVCWLPGTQEWRILPGELRYIAY